jgi:hypothetical protein
MRNGGGVTESDGENEIINLGNKTRPAGAKCGGAEISLREGENKGNIINGSSEAW